MFARYSRSGVALMGLPLYAGPLLAGWSAAPPVVIAVLAALFFLLQMLTGKPATRGAMPEAAFLVLLALVQIVVVALVYGAGALLALAFGPVALPVWLPLVLTGAGAVVGVIRYRRDPGQAEAMAMLDQAIDAIETGAPAEFGEGRDHDEDPELAEAADEALRALWALPPDARIAEIVPIVQRLEARVGPRGFQSLLAEIDEGSRAVDLAMLRYLASPQVRAALNQPVNLNFALSLLIGSDDATVMHELGTLTATLLAEGEPARNLPPPEPLRARAVDFPDLAALVEPVENAYHALRATAGDVGRA